MIKTRRRASVGREGGIFGQFAHVIDAIMSGGVNLVDIGVVAVGNHPTIVTNAAWLRGWVINTAATQGLGQNPRDGGFAHPRRPGEQKALRQSAALNRIGQGACNNVLTGDLMKGLWPVFACDDFVTHATHAEGYRGAASRCLSPRRRVWRDPPQRT